MFSIFGEPHNNFSEQVCVDDCHVATSDNTTLHLKIYIFFHTVAPRALSLCETQFSLEVGQGKCMSNPQSHGACDFQSVKVKDNSSFICFKSNTRFSGSGFVWLFFSPGVLCFFCISKLLLETRARFVHILQVFHCLQVLIVILTTAQQWSLGKKEDDFGSSLHKTLFFFY